MKRFGKYAILGSLIAVVSGAAFAHQHGWDGPCAGRWQHARMDPAPIIESRLAYIKTELKISAEQEGAWNDVAARVREAGQRYIALRKEWQNSSASTPDQIDQRLAAMKQGLQEVEAIAQSGKVLYAQLTPEQQAKVDVHLAQFKPAH